MRWVLIGALCIFLVGCQSTLLANGVLVHDNPPTTLVPRALVGQAFASSCTTSRTVASCTPQEWGVSYEVTGGDIQHLRNNCNARGGEALFYRCSPNTVEICRYDCEACAKDRRPDQRGASYCAAWRCDDGSYGEECKQ